MICDVFCIECFIFQTLTLFIHSCVVWRTSPPLNHVRTDIIKAAGATVTRKETGRMPGDSAVTGMAAETEGSVATDTTEVVEGEGEEEVEAMTWRSETPSLGAVGSHHSTITTTTSVVVGEEVVGAAAEAEAAAAGDVADSMTMMTTTKRVRIGE
jgi:hypothetical protein